MILFIIWVAGVEIVTVVSWEYTWRNPLYMTCLILLWPVVLMYVLALFVAGFIWRDYFGRL
jgi:hypothetical protein